MSKLIDIELENLQRECEFLFTSEQLLTIKKFMLNYAAAAIMDSSVRDEIYKEEI